MLLKIFCYTEFATFLIAFIVLVPSSYKAPKVLSYRDNKNRVKTAQIPMTKFQIQLTPSDTERVGFRFPVKTGGLALTGADGLGGEESGL